MRTLTLALALSSVAFADDGFEPNDTCPSAWTLAPGLYAGLEVTQASPFDFFRFTVGPFETLRATAHAQASGLPDLALFDATACTSISFDTGGLWTNGSNIARDVALRVNDYFGIGVTVYDLDVTIAVDPCLILGDDAFEPNESCSAPPFLGAGLYPGLNVQSFDRDLFRIPIPPGEIATIRADYEPSDGGLTLWNLLPVNCMGGYNTSHGFQGYELLEVKNTGTAVWNIKLDVDPHGSCQRYSLDISFSPDPCLALGDDALEPNDGIATATPIGVGTIPNLFAILDNEDWFRITLPAGAHIYAQTLFDFDEVDLNMRLYANGSVQDQSFDFGDSEQVEYVNTGTASVDIAFMAFVQATNGLETCGFYDLVVSIEAGPYVGAAFCPGDFNSTGAPSALVGTGSTSIDANDFGLKAIRVPANQLSSFAYGLVAGVIDLGGHDLCIGAPLFRSPVSSSGPEGIVTWSIDNDGEPLVLQGATVHFQTWYRDPTETPTYNLSNALAVTFTE